MAEQVPFKHKVAGSSPARPTPDPRTNARRPAGSIAVTSRWFGSIKGLSNTLAFQYLRVPVNTQLALIKRSRGNFTRIVALLPLVYMVARKRNLYLSLWTHVLLNTLGMLLTFARLAAP